MNIPDYVSLRIRASIPHHSVVRCSTPVLAFGPFQTVKLATLGINPSKHEFLDKHGVELADQHRRFETLTSLSIKSLEEIDDDAMARIVYGCNHYFLRNPYRRWFDQLEPMVNAANGSYYAGSACHLDLVQWSTDPIWRALDKSTQQHMLSADAAFLHRQLSDEHIEVLLLNGRQVMREFEALQQCPLSVTREIVTAHGRIQLVTGKFKDKIRVIGWSVNVQSSFGVTRELRLALANFVRESVA